MPVKRYQKCIPVEAIKFEGNDPVHVQEIIDFVGLPISIDYIPGGLKLRITRHSLDVLVANVGDFIVKNSEGKLTVMTQVVFETEYTEIL